MPMSHHNAAAIAPPRGYTHAVAVSSGKLIFVAGQVAWDVERNLVGHDHATQAAQAYTNVVHALAAAGASTRNIVKLNTYIVDYSPELLAGIGDAKRRVLGERDPAPSTMVGVTALAHPELLIEVDCVAWMEDG